MDFVSVDAFDKEDEGGKQSDELNRAKDDHHESTLVEAIDIGLAAEGKSVGESENEEVEDAASDKVAISGLEILLSGEVDGGSKLWERCGDTKEERTTK